MDNKNKKIILIAILFISCIIGSILAIVIPNSNINNEIGELQEEIIKELVVSDEVKSEANDTQSLVAERWKCSNNRSNKKQLS